MSWQETLRGRESEIPGKRLTVGFDGFVDVIVRPLRSPVRPGVSAQPFQTIREFGEFLISRAEKSCSIEWTAGGYRPGGNLPLLSRAAGTLGLSVSCIGMLGTNGMIDPLFADMPCKLYPFAPPGQSVCMEFNDGKVLFSSGLTIEENAWRRVMDATAGSAPGMFAEADLLALVNWSELSFSHSLWQHVLNVLLEAPPDKMRFAFFDLCDVLRKTKEELRSVLQLIGQFSSRRTTILSLNENEASVISERLLGGGEHAAETAYALHRDYDIDKVLVHTIHESVLVSSGGMIRQMTAFVANPCISTGAGDHFNGAFCFASVMGFSDADCVAFANEFAHFYILQGRAPSLEDLCEMCDNPHGGSGKPC